MKRLILTFALLTIALHAVAQEAEQSNRIVLGQDNNDAIAVNDGRLTLTLNGLDFSFKNNSDNEQRNLTIGSYASTKSSKRVYFSFAGCEAPSWNHLATIELGSNFLVNTDYSAYSNEEANQLAFGSNKSVYAAFNLFTLNVALNPSQTLGFTMGIGFACDNYVFANKYTMELREGMVHSVALDPSIKKSKLGASYFHIPILFDWNISHGFFISAGANIDVLMSSALVYKKPRTTIEGTMPLNPVNVGVTGRIGWNRLYVFANYSFTDMFKEDKGPKGRRMAIGAGLYF